MMLFSLTLGCTPDPPAPPPERASVPPPLDLPDVTGVDFEARFLDAIHLALSVNSRTLFDSHRFAIDAFEPSCPDVYVGLPPQDVARIDGVRGDASGFTWTDQCSQADGTSFSGFGYWESSVQAHGSPDTPEGITSEGARRLISNGVQRIDDSIIFGFDGAASDAVAIVVAEGYDRWSYTSLIEGTATGIGPFPAGSLAPEGWRTDLYMSLTGGAEERIELRGNVYLFEGRIGDRFDSVAVDLDLIGAEGAGPDDCLLEPFGWIGLRDPDAVWYDLVFLPRYANDVTGQPYPNDPLQTCDGCGTLYIRGVEQGQICPDFHGLQASLQPPAIEEFVLSIRDLPQESP